VQLAPAIPLASSTKAPVVACNPSTPPQTETTALAMQVASVDSVGNRSSHHDLYHTSADPAGRREVLTLVGVSDPAGET